MSDRGQGDLPAGAMFHDKLAKNWGAGYIRKSFKRRLELFESILARIAMPGQFWLDLGCGSGTLTALLLDNGCCVVAVDGSPLMLEEARSFLASRTGVGGVEYRLGKADDLSWCPNGRFDGVLCSSVVEYLENPDQLLAEACRVMKNDACLVMSIPPKDAFVRMLQRLLRSGLRLFGIERYGYLVVSRFELARSNADAWFADEGLAIVSTMPFDPVLPDWLIPFLTPALFVYEVRKSNAC